MSLSIGKYAFEGPFPHPSHLHPQPGIFAVLCEADGKIYPMDVGEGADVRAAVRSDERSACWEEHCTGNLMMAAYYTPLLNRPDRTAIVDQLRDGYGWPCGPGTSEGKEGGGS